MVIVLTKQSILGHRKNIKKHEIFFLVCQYPAMCISASQSVLLAIVYLSY